MWMIAIFAIYRWLRLSPGRAGKVAPQTKQTLQVNEGKCYASLQMLDHDCFPRRIHGSVHGILLWYPGYPFQSTSNKSIQTNCRLPGLLVKNTCANYQDELWAMSQQDVRITHMNQHIIIFDTFSSRPF